MLTQNTFDINVILGKERKHIVESKNAQSVYMLDDERLKRGGSKTSSNHHSGEDNRNESFEEDENSNSFIIGGERVPDVLKSPRRIWKESKYLSDRALQNMIGIKEFKILSVNSK